MARTPKPKTTEQICQEIVKAVKKIFRQTKTTFGMNYVEVPIYTSVYYDNNYGENLFTIRIEDYHTYTDIYFDDLTRRQVEIISQYIKDNLKTFEIETKKIYTGWRYDDLIVPAFIRKMGTPCNEFKQLVRLVKRKYHFDLKITDLYSVQLHGKRSSCDEADSRFYTAYDPEECKYYLKLIEMYGRKQGTCEIVDDSEVDDWSKQAECEYDGYTKTRLKIKLKNQR